MNTNQLNDSGSYPVSVALRNGKRFVANILDEGDGVSVLVQRIPSKRKEMFSFGWGLGDISEIGPMGSRVNADCYGTHLEKNLHGCFGRIR